MSDLPSKDRKEAIFKSILFCVVFTLLLVVFTFSKSFLPSQYERGAHGIIGALVALLVTWLFLRFDKKSFSDIGLKFDNFTVQKFFAGILIGLGLMGSLAFGVIYFSGFRIELNPNSNIFNFLFLTLPLIPLALMEEIGFRAYPLVTLQKRSDIRISIIVTSILFALYHIVNGWTIVNSFMGAGVWGIIFGVAAVYSKGIAMPTGLHYVANLTTAAFGVNNNSFNFFTLTQPNGSSLENYQASGGSVLIPQLILLFVGIMAMEWLIRKKVLK